MTEISDKSSLSKDDVSKLICQIDVSEIDDRYRAVRVKDTGIDLRVLNLIVRFCGKIDCSLI